MNELKSFLKQKNDLLKELLRYIRRQNFEDSEEDFDEIITYVNEKQKYIDKLKEIEDKIKACTEDGSYKDVKADKEANDEIIRDIIRLDKAKAVIMESLKDKLKKNMTGAKIQQRYSVSYNNYAMEIRGSRFDSKQ